MDVSKMPVVEQMKTDLRRAIKTRQSSAVIALRSMLSAIDNAGAVEVDTSIVPMEGRTEDVPRRELSEAELWELLHVEAASRRSAIVRYEQLGKETEAAQLRAELDVIVSYLEDPELRS